LVFDDRMNLAITFQRDIDVLNKTSNYKTDIETIDIDVLVKNGLNSVKIFHIDIKDALITFVITAMGTINILSIKQLTSMV